MAKGKNSNQSVQGEWLGNYYYAGQGQAFGFQAVFVQSGSSVEGNILDNGQLGEAKVFGSFAYPNLSFTKTYHAGRTPVEYRGTLNEEGDCLSGTWSIVIPTQTGGKVTASNGTWSAWRNLEDEEEEIRERETQQDFDVEEQEEVERPLVAPAKSR
jgi:hypothetical protein